MCEGKRGDERTLREVCVTLFSFLIYYFGYDDQVVYKQTTGNGVGFGRACDLVCPNMNGKYKQLFCFILFVCLYLRERG